MRVAALFLIVGLGIYAQAQSAGGLEAPILLEPMEGDTVIVEPPTFSWQAVEGAEQYKVDYGHFVDSGNYFTGITSDDMLTPHAYLFYCETERDTTMYWRVRAEIEGDVGPFSEPRSFRYVYFDRDLAEEGRGIVETASPHGDPCSNPTETGCEEFGGNTVWHDSNATEDYYISAGGALGGIDRLRRYVRAAAPEDYEIRFTERGGYGVYGFQASTIARVPFELWNVGTTTSDPTDDVRMIPFLVAEGKGELPYWQDQFTGSDPWPESPCKGGCPTTDWIYFLMPDRENGYELFEEAAIGFGGAGAIYDLSADGDTQVDINPYDGEACGLQGNFIDFCYRRDVLEPCWFIFIPAQRIYPLGRVVFADLAGDGTTPQSGTVVRFITNKSPLEVESEDPGPEDELPTTYSLTSVYPNPFSARTIVPIEVPEDSYVRVAVYDMLGREVSVLVDGQVTAGRHEAVLDGNGLASGVYLIRLQADGAVHATRKVLLLR